ncbi:hypothetical protein T440DRAFT_476244 [Plenodomus tracheiphilus IPT5]|uniref:Uncharacterized protein n=1 Tax=Plenodomus tracheiphilus IPT5 TaxID=1408161 RepID=A0A6A7BIR0_9PLEO|nr:hypothetical protein T440DRAFT_476244 [Plenodomus tracheiphilus IPT5]
MSDNTTEPPNTLSMKEQTRLDKTLHATLPKSSEEDIWHLQMYKIGSNPFVEIQDPYRDTHGSPTCLERSEETEFIRTEPGAELFSCQAILEPNDEVANILRTLAADTSSDLYIVCIPGKVLDDNKKPTYKTFYELGPAEEFLRGRTAGNTRFREEVTLETTIQQGLWLCIASITENQPVDVGHIRKCCRPCADIFWGLTISLTFAAIRGEGGKAGVSRAEAWGEWSTRQAIRGSESWIPAGGVEWKFSTEASRSTPRLVSVANDAGCLGSRYDVTGRGA